MKTNLIRAALACALLALSANAALAVVSRTAETMHWPSIAVASKDCTKAGGTVAVKNSISTCVFTDGRKAWVLVVSHAGASH